METPMLTERFDEALVYAHGLHREQRRKGTAIPYVAHLMAVSALVLEHGGNEDQAIGALLHDAAEDQGGQATLDDIRRRFGPEVARIVYDCTDSWEEPKPKWRERKEKYIASLPAKPVGSLLVSLADKVNNAEAILYDWRAMGDATWSRFNGGRDGTHWYYRSLAATYARLLPGRLAERLNRAVEAMTGDSPDAR